MIATVMRTVRKDEDGNYAGRDVEVGERLFVYLGNTYGCIDQTVGIALSEKDGETPFFEFPRSAVSIKLA